MLFLLYVKSPRFNNVCRRYKSLLHSQNMHCLFSDVNKELTNINEWFLANKLSLNVEKTKFSFFHKRSKKDNILLHLPNLTINNLRKNEKNP